MSIEVRDIRKTFGTFQALRGVSLLIPDGKLVALLGPSGSGKTTLLRIIAGLEEPDRGSGPILFEDRDVAGRHVGDRRVGFVFQHYALFRHMTVFENVAFGLRVRPRKLRPGRAEITRRVMELLALVQLDTLAQRYPHQLSGGQRQRIALVRALAVEPRVLLLDEPFGALDAKVRRELRQWLRRLHEQIPITSVFVTHDQEEALEVADQVVVMNEGRIEQVGSAETVFHNPATAFVMNFLGQVNVFHGRAETGRLYFSRTAVSFPHENGRGTQTARVFVRPHDWDVSDRPGGEGWMRATVRHINAAGPYLRAEMTTESGENIEIAIPHERCNGLTLTPGATLYVAPLRANVFLNDSHENPIVFDQNTSDVDHQRLMGPCGP